MEDDSLGTFDVGSLVQISATYKNAGGTLTNPASVTCVVVDPLGNRTTDITPANPSTGVFTHNVDLTSGYPGTWLVRWSSTGTPQVAEQSTFYVEPSI